MNHHHSQMLECLVGGQPLQYKKGWAATKLSNLQKQQTQKVLNINPIVFRPARVKCPSSVEIIENFIRNGNTLACRKPVSIVLYLELSCELKVHHTPRRNHSNKKKKNLELYLYTYAI